jgi:glycosyltransferase involved in cell wall biosynthesis
MKILIRGVRNNIHSVSMVNQFLLLALQGLPDVSVRHEDLTSRWPAGDCGFDVHDRSVIEQLQAPAEQDVFDVVLSYDQHQNMDQRLVPSKRYLFVVTEYGGFAPAALNMLKEQVALGAHIVTPSVWSAERLAERLGDAARAHIEVISHGVSGKYYWPLGDEARMAARASLGLGAHEFVFMNLGAGTWNKGIDLVLKAFDQVIRSGRHARLILKDLRLLYGNKVDDIISSMIQRQEISAASAEKIVFCPGQLSLSQMGTLYNLADCYVSPYRAEGFNLPVLEALACGTPAIVTRDGATHDFADERVSLGIEGALCDLPPDAGPGRYIDPSLDHLIHLMQASVDQDIKRAGRFSAGLADVGSRFGWERMARRHIEVFARAGR